MSLPDGFTPLTFDAAGGVPQAVPVPGPTPGLRATLVATAADLARLVAAPVDQVVHDTADSSTGTTAEVSPTVADHVAARRAAVAALTAGPPDSLSPSVVSAHLLVSGVSGVHASWPALPGRPLPVSGDGALLGELWVDELRLAAGSLVRGGECGSRISIGWRSAPAPSTGSAASTIGAARITEEDPYVSLV